MSSPLLARFLFLPNTLADRLPPFTQRPAVASHAAFTARTVLFGRPTACRASSLVSLFAYREPYPAAMRELVKLSWGHARIFPAVPSANTLVRRVDEYAFVSILQTRPCPVFGRPVRLRGGPHRLRPGSSPHALRIPSHDGHPALPNSCRGQRGITPAFGYGSLHLETRGTSTLLIRALPSAHYGSVRLPPKLSWISDSALYQESLSPLLQQGLGRASPVDTSSFPACRP